MSQRAIQLFSSLSIIFIAIVSALAVALASVSGANVQIAENQRKVGTTRACADSGLEVVRYWMNQVAISGTTADDQRFSAIAASLQATDRGRRDGTGVGSDARSRPDPSLG